MPLAVAALPVIIVAIVAMIILWGLAMLLRATFQSLANHVPVIGGTISRSIGAMIDNAIQLGSIAARAVVADAVGFILSPVYWIERHIVTVINFLTSLVDAIRYITTRLIPDEVAALETDIAATYHDATAYARALAQQIETTLAADVAQLAGQIAAAESALAAYAQALTAGAEAYTAAAIDAETHFVLGTAASLAAEITQAAGAESAYARALYTDAITYTQTLVTTAEAGLAADISGTLEWTRTQVTALDAAIAAMGAGVIALTADAVATIESDIDSLKTECTDNLCSGLSDLATLFNGLQGELGLAALFALAAEFAADPHRAAADVRATLGPLAADAAGAVRTLIGL